ncbi:MAG: helix-turn-helix domain-containing protein [Pseudomonadota bacterium]|nr:helix-turn-helix domain-containing protein [Pseudomonadota bacterium]
MSAAASCAGFESAPAAGLVEAELLKLARLILGKQQEGTPEQEGRPRVSRPTIIRRSRDLLEARAGERVSVRELTSAAGVSERTLRTAFNDYFGVGPAHYLQLRQLHQVHRALRAAGPGSRSVTDVLVRHGVWEFGHFASRYHRLFGETPSKTLRTKHRR